MTMLNYFFGLSFLISVLHVFPTSAQQLIGSVELHHEALEDLIDPDAQLEVLADGFYWTEGPVWVREHEFLLFSDVYTNKIYQWSAENDLQVFLEPSGYTGSVDRAGALGSNGLTINSERHLLIAQHGDRRIAQLKGNLSDHDSALDTVVDQFDGAKLHSPNDLVLHSSGTLYFTDPAYGLVEGMSDPSKEIDFQGVYSLTPDGQVTLLESELSHPNGLAFSPDEKILYVSNSNPEEAIWMAYDVLPDGSLSNGRVFFDATDKVGNEFPGLPDGLKVDVHGNIFASGPGGILVFNPEGDHLGTINTTTATANCAFGDDGSTLYVTANMNLLRIPLRTHGAIP